MLFPLPSTDILKIDNLWEFTSLTKLQLDNNIIEKIEGLDVLVNLIWLGKSILETVFFLNFQTYRERKIENKDLAIKKVSSVFTQYVCMYVCLCVCVCLFVGGHSTDFIV